MDVTIDTTRFIRSTMTSRTNPFTIIRKTSHKLGDMSRFLSGTMTDSFSRGEIKFPMRKSREERKTTCLDLTSDRTRHHSLISMRTYYAFGARSHSIAVPQTHRPHSLSSMYLSDIRLPPLRQSSYVNCDEYLRRPFSSSIGGLKSSSFTDARTSLLISRYCRTSKPSTSTSNTSFTNYSTLPSANVIRRRSPPMMNATCSDRQMLDKRERNLSISMPSYRITSDRRSEQKETSPVETTSKVQIIEKIPEMPVRVIQKMDQATSSSIENLVNHSELEELRAKNKELESEVKRLKLQLRDRDRTETELKRRILECDAETKVWRTKCEHFQPTVIQITEPSLDPSLIEQLDNAANKLANLNVTNDLKLLQSEMESAMLAIAN